MQGNNSLTPYQKLEVHYDNCVKWAIQRGYVDKQVLADMKAEGIISTDILTNQILTYWVPAFDSKCAAEYLDRTIEEGKLVVTKIASATGHKGAMEVAKKLSVATLSAEDKNRVLRMLQYAVDVIKAIQASNLVP